MTSAKIAHARSTWLYGGAAERLVRDQTASSRADG